MSATARAEIDVHSTVQQILPSIETRLDPAFIAGAKAQLAAYPDKPLAAGMGIIMLLRRHLPEATWFLAQDALNRPGDLWVRNNLGVLLHELSASKAEAQNRTAVTANQKDWLTAATVLLKSAVSTAPKDPFVTSNYGIALLAQWRRDPNSASLDEAALALRQSIAAGPEGAWPYAHLAEVLLAQGALADALKTINEAHQRWSADPVVMKTMMQNPGLGQDGGASRSYCNSLDVEALCKKYCPCTSIVGCLNFVTCNISSDSFVAACHAGRPIPSGFDCEQQAPTFGIIVPGLQDGFGFSGFGYKFTVTWDGKGGYKWEAEYSKGSRYAEGYIKASGHIDPRTGEISGFSIDHGVKFNLGPEGGDLGQAIRDSGQWPGTITFGTDVPGGVRSDLWQQLSSIRLAH